MLCVTNLYLSMQHLRVSEIATLEQNLWKKDPIYTEAEHQILLEQEIFRQIDTYHKDVEPK